MTPAARAVDALLGQYQVHLSPRKGYACAHRIAHGGTSCSGAVRELVRGRGVVRALMPTVTRFVACWHAARLLMASDVRGVCCCGPIPISFRF